MRILVEPKNALVKQYRRVFELDNVELEITDDALEAVADQALLRGTGARGLRAILEEVLLEVMYDLPSRSDVGRCVVDQVGRPRAGRADASCRAPRARRPTARAVRRPDADATAADRLSRERHASLGDALAWLDRHVNLEAIERGVAGRAARPTLDRMRALVDGDGRPPARYPGRSTSPGRTARARRPRIAAAAARGPGPRRSGTYHEPAPRVDERADRRRRRADHRRRPRRAAATRSRTSSASSLGRERPRRAADLVRARHRRRLPLLRRRRRRRGGRRGRASGAAGTRPTWSTGRRRSSRTSSSTTSRSSGRPGPTIARGEGRDRQAGLDAWSSARSDPEIVEVFAARGRRVGAEALWRRGVDFDCDAQRARRRRSAPRPAHARARPTRSLPPACTAPTRARTPRWRSPRPRPSSARRSTTTWCARPSPRRPVPGRLEVVGRHPLVVLDGAHNPAGAAGSARRSPRTSPRPSRIVVVVGLPPGQGPGRAARGARARADRPGRRVPAAVAAGPASRGGRRAAAAGLGHRVVVDRGGRRGARAWRCRPPADEDLVLVTGSLYVVGAAPRGPGCADG